MSPRCRSTQTACSSDQRSTGGTVTVSGSTLISVCCSGTSIAAGRSTGSPPWLTACRSVGRRAVVTLAMKPCAEHPYPYALRACVLMLVTLGSTGVHAQDVSDDGRVGVIFAHPTLLDRVSGAPYVWVDDQTGSVTSYRVAIPNLIYHATPWLQGWGGVIVNWKNDSTSDDTRELRPYIGVKVFVPN